MALRNQPEFEKPNAAAAAEVAEAAPAAAEAAPTTEAKAAADVAATTAIAKAATTAVGSAKKMVIAFAASKDTIDTNTVSALAMSSPRITAEQGSAYLNRKEDLGKVVHIEIVSWNHRWAIGTGENDKEAVDYFKVSYNGETLDGEPDVTVAAYLESLKSEGFSKAKVSPYADLWGFVTYTEKKGDIPEDQRELTVVQLSQTSLGNFTSFCVSRGLLESRGVAQPATVIELHAEAQESRRGDRYTNFSFKAAKTK